MIVNIKKLTISCQVPASHAKTVGYKITKKINGTKSRNQDKIDRIKKL